jgi:putative sugar O-methyltransferase
MPTLKKSAHIKKKIFLQLIKDKSRCYKYTKTSDTYIETTKNIKKGLNYDNFKSLLSNSYVYSITTSEYHPSLIFDSYGEEKIFKKLIQKKEANILNPHKEIKIKNNNFSSVYLTNMKIASKIIYNLKERGGGDKKITIFEIGGGLGVLAQILLSNLNCRIILCDLPQQLSIQKFYLTNIFKNKKHNFVANDQDKFNKNCDINYINCSLLHKQKFNFDAAININSFQEMQLNVVDNYIKFIEENLNEGGLFLHQNCIGHAAGSSLYPTDYYLPNKFIIQNIEYDFQSYRGQNFPWFTLTSQKNTEHLAQSSLIEKRKKILKQFYKSNNNQMFLSNIDNAKKTIIKKLNANKKKNVLKNKFLNKKNNISDSKINNVFISINESILNDLKKLDHSFNSTKKLAIPILNKKEIFKDPYWGMRLSGLFYGINDLDKLKLALKLIKNNSFSILFRKLIFYSKIKHDESNDKIYDQLIKRSNGDFLSDLKISYCAKLLEKYSEYSNKRNKIISKVINSEQAIVLSKTVLKNDFNEYINIIKNNKHLKKYITHDVLTEILINSGDVLLSKNKIFYLLKNINFKFKKDINSLILLFKIGQIDEDEFMNYITKNIIKSYYLIGKVMLKTYAKT